jgi:FKBP-type peptidyl-prolyl cis-trans isomerase
VKPWPAAAKARELKIPTGLAIQELAPGDGPVATKGSRVTVHCTMSLRKGAVVWDTRKNEPWQFTIGERRNVAALEYGVLEMRRGGRRRIVAPPAFGYRGAGIPGQIPPNAILILEVEMLSVEPRGDHDSMKK